MIYMVEMALPEIARRGMNLAAWPPTLSWRTCFERSSITMTCLVQVSSGRLTG
jgi:hypothetical protein